MPIDSIDSLREHLQTALVLEHATIPAYLTALYSIKDGHNAEAAEVIQSVVMEEMLHMALVANVLNAVGGDPIVDAPDFVPDYPTALPHSSGTFQVGLLPFSPEALEIFVRIERPAPADAPAQADEYETIGQFYKAIFKGIEKFGDFKSDRKNRQVEPHHFYYGGGGDVVKVNDLTTAQLALDEVIEQGEGLDHTIFDGDEQFGQRVKRRKEKKERGKEEKDHKELAHYFRFNEILVGRYYRETDTPASGPTGSAFPVDWSAVWNVSPNPKAARYRNRPDIYDLMVDFNRSYTHLLRVLHQAFNGAPEKLMGAVPLMYELRDAAQRLVRIPTGDGTTTVGPSFEYWTD